MKLFVLSCFLFCFISNPILAEENKLNKILIDPHEYVYSLGFTQKDIITQDNQQYYSFLNRFVNKSKLRTKEVLITNKNRALEVLAATLLMLR